MMAAEKVLPFAKPHPVDFVKDDQLLAACRRGDLRAFEQIYETHGPRLKSVALQMLGNRHDAEDAVQETFLKVYRGGWISKQFEPGNVDLPDFDQYVL